VFCIEPARGLPRREPRARQLHDAGRAHAGVAPRAPGMDACEAHRVGPAHRREHRCGGDLAARTSPASRARLPRLPGPAGPRAQVHARAAGGRLHARHGDPRPTLKSVTNILKCGLDRQPTLFPTMPSVVIDHENVRGPDYYH
jgi:hypothetical protein